jgi:hypothetical protein
MARLATAPHELSNYSKFANFNESNRIRTLDFGLRIYGRFDSTKFANFEHVRELLSSIQVGFAHAHVDSHNLNNTGHWIHSIRT